MKITKIERNRIYEAIATSDLDPAECELYVQDDQLVIRHQSGSTLEFEHKNVLNSLRYVLEFSIVDGTEGLRVVESFNAAESIVQEWADEIKLISEAPDLWEEMRLSRELITSIQQTDSDNTPFTPEEQKHIADQLQEIRQQLREQFELTAEQLEHIDERLDEAAGASKRMGRKDWLLLFGGTVFNLIVTDTITPGVAGHIFTSLIQGIAHLFGAGPPQILS